MLLKTQQKLLNELRRVSGLQLKSTTSAHRPRSSKRLIVLFLSLSSLLTFNGCATTSSTTIEKVGPRTVEYAMTRHDGIPVVFENGLAGRLEWWAKVLAQISEDTTTFVYNRPGYGASEPAVTPRDGTHIVEELRTLLRSKGLMPPYILVGHSLGGLYLQQFARMYPSEVHALILVDSTHPRQLEGEGDLEKQPFWVRVLLDFSVTGAARDELNLLSQSGRDLLDLPALQGRPVYVLSALKPMRVHSPIADDANQKRNDLVRLNPGSKQILVDSDHGIPLEDPDSIVAVIREALTLP